MKFLFDEFQVKCDGVFLHSSTSTTSVYPECSLLKKYTKKEGLVPCCSPESFVSLISVRRHDIQTANKRGRCILSVAFISMITDGDRPKKRPLDTGFCSGKGQFCFPAASQMTLSFLRCTVVTSKEHLCYSLAPQRFSCLPGNPISISFTTHHFTWNISVVNAHHNSAGNFGCHHDADPGITVVTGPYSGAGGHTSSAVL